MTGLLIPFGLDRNTRDIVEPEDAARGRACNCICPGCAAPLLSRHPKENRIHFAHDSKHPEAKPEEECPFSSAVDTRRFTCRRGKAIKRLFNEPNTRYYSAHNLSRKPTLFGSQQPVNRQNQESRLGKPKAPLDMAVVNAAKTKPGECGVEWI